MRLFTLAQLLCSVSLLRMAAANRANLVENAGSHGIHPTRNLTLQKRMSGQGTYYVAGLGACGNWNTASDWIVALNHEQWDGGIHCGESLTITALGKTATVVVEDECMGCDTGCLDMTSDLFSFFADLSVGRFPLTWEWGSGDATHTTSSTTAQKTKSWSTPVISTASITSAWSTTTTTSSLSSVSVSAVPATSSSSTVTASPSHTVDATAAAAVTVTVDAGSESDGKEGWKAIGNIAVAKQLVYNFGNIAFAGKSRGSG